MYIYEYLKYSQPVEMQHWSFRIVFASQKSKSQPPIQTTKPPAMTVRSTNPGRVELSETRRYIFQSRPTEKCYNSNVVLGIGQKQSSHVLGLNVRLPVSDSGSQCFDPSPFLAHVTHSYRGAKNSPEHDPNPGGRWQVCPVDDQRRTSRRQKEAKCTSKRRIEAGIKPAERNNCKSGEPLRQLRQPRFNPKAT